MKSFKSLIYLKNIKPINHEPLKIKKVFYLKKRLHLLAPFTTSFGTITTVIHFYPKIIFKTLNDREIEGIGECPPLPYPWYDGESHHLTEVALKKYLIPLLQNSKNEIKNIIDFLNIYSGVTGIQRNFMAKVGIEGAYWDAIGKLLNKPVYQLWTNKKIEKNQSGTSVGGKTIEETLERIDVALKMKIKRIKVKIKPDFDVELVKKIREKFPNIMLQVDANSAYDLNNEHHLKALKKLDEFNLLMIEQPLWNDDRFYHLRLSKIIKTPICLDESIENARHVAEVIEMWKSEGILNKLVINIKPPRVGGFWEAVKIAKLCKQFKVKTWCGGMLESAVGKTANVHFSVLTDLPGDHVSQGKYFVKDVSDLPLLEKGFIKVPQQPGWGTKNLDFK